MSTAIFIFNIAQLLMIIGMFYYALFYKVKKEIKSNKNNDDDGGLLIETWPNVILPPIAGIDYPSHISQQELTTH